MNPPVTAQSLKDRTIRILLVEDSVADATYVRHILPDTAYKVSHVNCLEAAKNFLANDCADVVLLDLLLPDEQGLPSFVALQTCIPNIPILILTGLEDEETVIEAVKLGAQDYLMKREISEPSLPRAIRYAIERKYAEEAIRKNATQAIEAETSLRLALSASNTGIWSYDIATNSVTGDALADAVFGVEPGSFGSNVQDFYGNVHAEDRERIKTLIGQSIENKTQYEAEYRIIRPDGSLHYVAAKGQPYYDQSDNPIRMIGVCMDITKNKIEEETAKRLQALEQREDFVATLTHDLKNPLIGADRILKLLIEGAFGAVPKEQMEVIELLRQSNEDMLALIHNLLDINRLEAGAPPLKLTEVDVSALAANCITQLAGIARDTNIKLIANFKGQAHTISADAVALRRVLFNLLGNALKFTPSGEIITVSGSTLNGNYVLEVQDTGSGISPEELEHLFSRFVQGRLGKKYGAGTGLGLYLCRKLIEAHGGRITCLSNQGVGTTFRVELPNRQ